LVVIVGGITLLFGAVIGTAKDDIKKALAASTMSQIGYMILASGLGPVGYAIAIMHLLTHGFFKAGMFLGAGSVMHGMDDEVNMRRYGAIGKMMPITFATFGMGYLAIIGVPPFAGFYSKDKIIEIAFNAGGTKGIILGGAALLGAAITAFYMTRLVVMTFTGSKRWDDNAHPHESPILMWLPMGILAVGSVVSGFFFNSGNSLVNWLAPVLNSRGEKGGAELLHPVVVSTMALAAVVIGVVIAVGKYRTEVPAIAPENVSIFTKIARKDLMQDAFNEAVLMRPGQKLTTGLVKTDYVVIDGLVRLVGAIFASTSRALRQIQNGYVRSYALIMAIGALALIATIWVVTL
jgi:NADH-quinone oxidoreductase subunit L